MDLLKLDLPRLILDLRADLRLRLGFDQADRHDVYVDWLITSGLEEYKALEETNSLDPWLADQVTDAGLSRLQYLLWRARADVQQAFPLPEQVDDYLAWFFRHGVGEHMAWLWRRLTPTEQRKACLTDGPWQPVLLDRSVNDLLAEPDDAPAGQRPWGVNLVGYVHGQLGIGEDVRMAAHALQAAGVPFAMVNFKPGHDIPQNDLSLAQHVVDEGPYAINIFCLTAMEHGRFYAERGRRQLQGRYNIGYWPWELSLWPQEWQQLVHLVDEVWVSTRHTQQAVAPFCAAQTPPIPLQLMPMAVTVTGTPPHGQALQAHRRTTRQRLGLPDGACLFCFSFDLNSSIHRKNPQAVVKAFLRAFEGPQWGAAQVGLVIKVHPPKQPHKEWNALKALAQQDPRFHIVEQTLPRDELLALYQACDCFVSLHRAEGFGRGIAEALQLGLRVITTGYSGNVDFCQHPDLAPRVHLVRHRLVKVKPGQYPYPDQQVWANADTGHAARCMQAVAQTVAVAEGQLLPVPPGGWPVFSEAEVGQRYKARLASLPPPAPAVQV